MFSATEHGQKVSELEAENSLLSARNAELVAQVKWFQKQLFGQKSERRVTESPAEQLFLGQQFQTEADEEETRTIKEHKRKKRQARSEDGDNQKLFFDETVPVEEIKVANPEAEGLSEDEFEVISQKTTYRLAQRPGVYVVLKYVRDVIKKKSDKKEDAQISCPPAPSSVFDKSHADVSFLAGLLIDKFAYHLPLYRQHQRLQSAGIDVSRAWLTQLVHRSGDLLEPIYYALVDSIRESRVKIMDETPIKAGRKIKGKMRQAYFWPVLGESNEIAFFYFDSRNHCHVFEALGEKPGADSVIVSDGYEAYKKYATETDTLNAQCWAHSRRKFLKAENIEPEKVETALEYIRCLYEVEKKIREQGLTGDEKCVYRVLNSKPISDAFFSWVSEQLKEETLLPSSPLSTALNYVNKRKDPLELFLTDPDIPIDTNELERALRVIPMGRKNWLFCWTEVGAKYVGIFQSLIVTCKMHGVDPYTYLVDVLQRVGQHPQSEIHQLTPANWKALFADNPLTSDFKF